MPRKSQKNQLFRAIFEAWCLKFAPEQPVPEHYFHPERKWRFDWCFLELKIAIEIQGGIWNNGGHNRGRDYEGDCEKHTEAGLLGWMMIYVSWEQVNNGVLWGYLERAFKARSENR